MRYGTLDHAFVTLLVLTGPLLGAWMYRRMTAALAAGEASIRAHYYRWGIGLELLGAAEILLLFAIVGRPVDGLMRLDWLPRGWWTGAAWGLVLLACAFLVAQVVAIRGNEAGLSAVRRQMASVEGILPHTPGELKLFLVLSLAAGVGEEIVFRGYLLPYFDALAGPVTAVLASTLLFGMGHAYQGVAGMVRTGIFGLLYAAAFVGTGSLLAPILLHAVTDAASGIMAHLALTKIPVVTQATTG